MAFNSNILEDAPSDRHLLRHHAVISDFRIIRKTKRGAAAWHNLTGACAALLALAHVGNNLISKVFGKVGLDTVEEFALGRLMVLTIEAYYIDP
jgi:hypothetical protein